MVQKLLLRGLYGVSPCKTLTGGSRITEVEGVYCAVRTDSLYKIDTFRL